MDLLTVVVRGQQRGEPDKKSVRRRLRSQIFLVWVFIVAVVVVGNVVYLTGLTNSDPLPQRAGISSSLTYGLPYGENTIDPNDGYTTQALGHLAADELLHGNLPYWNHYIGVGAPLAGEMQPAALFPLVLVLRLDGGVLIMHLLLEVLAGVATAHLLLRLGLRLPAVLAGGALFALNGTFAWIASAGFNPVAFLPLMLLGVERARAAAVGGQGRGFRLLALALALSLYAGFPETAYVDALFAAAWALVRLRGLQASVRWAYVRKLVAGGVTGLLLAAPIVVSFIGYLPVAGLGRHSVDLERTFVVRAGVPNLIMPYITGPIFGFGQYRADPDLTQFWRDVGGYLTSGMLCLGLLGLRSVRLARSLRIFLAVFVALCVIKIFALLGDYSHFLNVIPGIKLVAFYRYSPPALTLAAVILAAAGIDHVLDRPSQRVVLITLGASCALLSALLLIAKHQVDLIHGAPGRLAWAAGSAALAVGCVAFITAACLVRSRVRPRLLAALLLFIPVAESTLLYALPQLSAPRSASIDTQLVSYLQQRLGQQRYYTLGPLAPNYGSFYRLASVNENELPYPKLWGDYLQTRLDTNTDPVLFTGNFRADPRGPSAVAEFARNIDNYRAVGVSFVLASKGSITAGTAASIGIVPVYGSPTADVFALPRAEPYAAAPGCQLTADSRDAFRVHCERAGTLTRRELFMPGWSAQVSGRARAVGRTESIFQSLALPAGDSRVTFSYAPPYIEVGYVAFAGGLLMLTWGARKPAGAGLRSALERLRGGSPA